MNDVLKNALKSGNIAGAYIIEGVSTEAVLSAADEFLMSLYCKNGNACRACPGCAKYIARTHADLFVVEGVAPDKSIRAEETREIVPFVYRKSFEGGYKAVLIPNANSLTEASQNVLLKVLEEPPDDTVFLLGTYAAKYLLPTILSRCIILKTVKNEDGVAERLVEEFSLSTVKARVLLKAAENDYFLAAKYAGEDYFGMRADMMLMLGRLFSAKSMATSATEKLLLKQDSQMNIALCVALLYLKDVLIYRHTGNADLIANFDVLPEVEKHAKEPDVMLVNTIEIISCFLKECELCPGLNKKLMITGMFFDILSIKQGTGLRKMRIGASK